MSAFRSHLMQQFAAAARGQSRPPLALAQIYGDSSNTSSRQSTPSPPSPSRRAPSSSTGATSTAQTISTRKSSHLPSSSSPTRTRNSLVFSRQFRPNDVVRRTSTSSIAKGPRSLSSNAAAALGYQAAAAAADRNANIEQTSENNIEIPELQHSFQNLLKTRRTISNLKQPDGQTTPPNLLSAAITRAVQCAIEGPNHKRTEPYTFTRLISPSATTEALADVCYHVSVRRMRERQKGSEATLLAEAERKRNRWRNIPAFLVASVGGMPDQVPALEMLVM